MDNLYRGPHDTKLIRFVRSTNVEIIPLALFDQLESVIQMESIRLAFFVDADFDREDASLVSYYIVRPAYGASFLRSSMTDVNVSGVKA